MKQFLKSKRFVLTSVSLALWVLMVLVFNKDELNTATGIGIISGIYGLGESLRPSMKQ